MMKWLVKKKKKIVGTVIMSLILYNNSNIFVKNIYSIILIVYIVESESIKQYIKYMLKNTIIFVIPEV